MQPGPLQTCCMLSGTQRELESCIWRKVEDKEKQALHFSHETGRSNKIYQLSRARDLEIR